MDFSTLLTLGGPVVYILIILSIYATAVILYKLHIFYKVNFFNNDNFLTYGKNAKNFSERFHWDKVVKNYLKLIN